MTPAPNKTTTIPSIDIRLAATRPRTHISWLDGRHSFSFGDHYNPDNTHHGLLMVSNDDRIAPGGGFGTHPHRDMEIVTWVLDGELDHRDSEGNHGVLFPGLAQRMSAGSGIRHSEMNHSSIVPVHLVQMWVPPDATNLAPSYEQRDMNDRLTAGGLVAIASGRGHEGAISIHQRDAVMWVARLAPGETVELPDAPYVHLFLARGDARLSETRPAADTEGTVLLEGDAVRFTEAGAGNVIEALDHSEIIVWESHSSL